jgi:hypothetical protein
MVIAFQVVPESEVLLDLPLRQGQQDVANSAVSVIMIAVLILIFFCKS